MLKFHSVSVNGMIVRGQNVGIGFFFYSHPVYEVNMYDTNDDRTCRLDFGNSER